MNTQAQCKCGSTQVHIHGKPLIRGFCHCTICQAFNQAAYADVTFFRAKDVTLPEDGMISYKSYSSSNAVQRGRCTSCDQPFAEKVHVRSLERLVIIPTNTIQTPATIPAACMHIFYHRRVADINDDLPKYSGFWPSQLAFSSQLLVKLLRSRFQS